MCENFAPRISDTGQYVAKVYGPWNGTLTYEGKWTNPVDAAEDVWEMYGAHGVEIYTNATAYINGATPVAMACQRGCGHAVPLAEEQHV